MPTQVLRVVLDDEDNENDNNSQHFIGNDENDPLQEQQPNFRLPSPRERSSKLAIRSCTFCNLSNSVDNGSQSTSSVTQSTPDAKATAIPCLKHPKKGFSTVEVLEQVMNGSDMELDNHSEDDDAGQLYSDNTYEPS